MSNDNPIVRKRPSIFWPLLLIVVGGILLLNTLGIITGSVWSLIVNLWPLLFILGGLDNLFRGEGLIWGILSIGFGVVFLLSNFGYLQVGAWSLLLRLWPLLLVAVGLDLIFSGRSTWLNLAGVLIGLVILAGVVWFAISNQVVTRAVAQPVDQPMGDVQKANLYFSNPVGWMELGPGAEGSQLVGGNTYEPRQNSLNQRYAIEGDTGSYSLSDHQTVVTPFYGGIDRPLWELTLSSKVPLSLETSTGVGKQTIDLNGVDISALHLEVAIGSLDLTLPADELLSGSVSVPIGNVQVTVPEGALVEIQLDSGLTVKSLAAGFSQDGDRIYSPGANAENARVHLSIDQPIGILSVESGS